MRWVSVISLFAFCLAATAMPAQACTHPDPARDLAAGDCVPKDGRVPIHGGDYGLGPPGRDAAYVVFDNVVYVVDLSTQAVLRVIGPISGLRN
ncbi:MAG: hypothetical protein AAGF74_01115 [Pseudomonadota bacterium]